MTSTFEQFKNLHRPGDPLLLPNAWDVGSAKAIAALGAKAIATTSAGVAWSQGRPDGGALGQAANLDLAQALVRNVTVPVSVDVENTYTDDPVEAANFLAALSTCGVVGVNVEDSTAGRLRDAGEFTGFLREVRSALAQSQVEIFLNVRVDSYLLGTGEEAGAVHERAEAYVDAGADGVFVPGLADLPTIEALVANVSAPINVMAGGGAPTVAELAGVGVARISTGMWLTQVAYGAAFAAAEMSLSRGTFESTSELADYARMNEIMEG